MCVRTALLGLFTTTLMACQTGETNGLSDDDLAAIRGVFENHRENVLAGNWSADLDLYTEDAVRLPPFGAAVQGRTAIAEELFAIDTVLAFEMNTIEIDGRGDLAYVWNTYTLSAIPVGSEERVAADGKSILILRRDADGSWRIHRVIWNSNQAPS